MSELSTIALIRELIQFLSRDRLTAEEVIARVGAAADDASPPMPVEIRPAIPGVDSASLARYPENGLPYLLELGFSPAMRPPIRDLEQAFGDFRQGLTDPEAPVTVSFHPPSAGAHWTVVLVAVLESANGRLDEAPAQRLMLRRMGSDLAELRDDERTTQNQ